MLSDLLMWNKIGRIVMRLSEKLEVINLQLAKRSVFYMSKVCDRLHDPETELYIFSDAYIVDEIMMELYQS